MILPVRRILPIMAVEHQQGQGTDQVFAAGEALPPGLAIGRVRQEPPDRCQPATRELSAGVRGTPAKANSSAMLSPAKPPSLFRIAPRFCHISGDATV